jgi:hypothetical protein
LKRHVSVVVLVVAGGALVINHLVIPLGILVVVLLVM